MSPSILNRSRSSGTSGDRVTRSHRSRDDVPALDLFAAAHDHHLAGEIDHGANVVGNDRDDLADGRRR